MAAYAQIQCSGASQGLPALVVCQDEYTTIQKTFPTMDAITARLVDIAVAERNVLMMREQVFTNVHGPERHYKTSVLRDLLNTFVVIEAGGKYSLAPPFPSSQASRRS